jgi:hypothetical protein
MYIHSKSGICTLIIRVRDSASVCRQEPQKERSEKELSLPIIENRTKQRGALKMFGHKVA